MANYGSNRERAVFFNTSTEMYIFTSIGELWRELEACVVKVLIGFMAIGSTTYNFMVRCDEQVCAKTYVSIYGQRVDPCHCVNTS